MNLDSLSFTLSQISYLVASITRRNHRQVVAELQKLVNLHGLEADRHLLKCLFHSVDFSESSSKITTPTIHNQVLLDSCSTLLNKPSLVSAICYITDSTLTNHKSLKVGAQFFPQLCKCLRLSAVQEVVFALALLHSSSREIVAHCHTHLRSCVPPLVKSYVDTEGSGSQHEGGLHETTPEVLHIILSAVFKSPKELGVAADLQAAFINALQRDFPKEHVPVVLAPLVYPADSELAPEMSGEAPGLAGGIMDCTMADLIKELGYGFTATHEECRSYLHKLNRNDITPAQVAKILIVMCRTVNGLDESLNFQAPGSFNKASDGGRCTTWNAEVFVQALMDTVQNLSWSNVMFELDQPEFLIKDRQSLMLLVSALRLGLQATGFRSEAFPVEHFYRRWVNIEGQLSLLQQILKSSDVFSFSDHPCSLVPVDVLKTPPEQDSKELATWRSMNLVEVLLSIAECGCYSAVQDLFKFPIQNCPDVLILALLNIQGPLNMLRQELLTVLFPVFLGNHANSAIILHHAWHSQNGNIKPAIMHAMAEWYARGDGDQARLSRILDVAQDLKALSMLLNVQSYPFIIDLACLASRREYLKLEKWLQDKIREHGENFVSACIKFLHRRCPQILGKSDDALKSNMLPSETLTTIVICLRNTQIINLSPECHDAIASIASNYQILLSNRQQQQQQQQQAQQQTTLLRPHRGMDVFNASSIGGGPLFNSTAAEGISSIGSSLANMSLAGQTNSSFTTLQGGLGQLVASPGSPNRILAGPSNSPFPIMPMQHQGPVGTGASLVPNMNTLGRMGGPNPGGPGGLPKTGMPDSTLFPEIAPNVSKDIEDEANSYFQRIYNHPPHPTLSIDEVLEMLKRFQESPMKREREVFHCMLRNLFEEYKFFPQYPDKELHITAQLFGGIIERGLVTSYMALGLALRFVLDALRKPEGSKMYYFGIAALDRFKTRLKEYHKYCEHVRAIPHFAEFPPHLIEYVEYGLQSAEPPSKPQGPVLPNSLTTGLGSQLVSQPYKPTTASSSTSKVSSSSGASLATRPSIANATNIDTLLVATEKEEIMSPPEQLQDKIAFIFNNLSQLNLQKKCDELREIVSDEYWAWISQYLVMKRASIELNFHQLYSNFLDVLKVPEVNRMVTKETFRNIKVLLRSDKVIDNFSDRSLLKNLGHWLGMMTLGRNKPILQIDIDLKSLLIEAYHKGQQELLYIVPFIAKILESCAKSKVFKAPNPWTIAIMNVLAEMHQEPDLKLNLKFEIEVLCKTLDIEITNLKPTTILKDPEVLRKLEYQLRTQSMKKEVVQMPSQLSIQSVINDAEMNQVTVQAASTPPVAQNNSTTPTSNVSAPEPRFSYMDIQLSNNATFQSHITISPAILLFQTQPQLKSFVKTAIDRAVQDWIAPVVDRSIKIAIQTCEHITRKDFALDPDENRMRSASHYMVRNLTAGMAMITCRDQLLTSINTQFKVAIKTAINSPTAQQRDMIEQAASIIAQDNMEFACAFIQKTAIEKAIPEMDKRLISEFELRKMARQDGRRYCDAVALTYQAERMPEAIRLKVGGISPSQMSVYEEFARNIPGFLPLTERDSALFIPKPTVVMEQQQQPPPPTHTSTSFQMSQSDDLVTLFEKLALEADQFIQATNGQGAYAAMYDCMVLIRECLMFSMHNREIGSSIATIQKCVESLQEAASPNNSDPVNNKYKEIIVRILKSLQDPRAYGQQWINKNVTRFLSDFRDDMRFNEIAVETLIRAGLVNLPTFDLALAQCMENGPNYRAVTLATVLVQSLLVDDRSNQFVTETELGNTIEMMMKINSHLRPPPDALSSVLEMLRQQHDQNIMGDRAAGPVVQIHNGILQVRAPNYEDPPGLMDKTDYLIRDWINIYNAQPTGRDSTKAFSLFVHQMNLQGILKTDDLITRFFRLSTQMCVEIVYRNMSDQPLTNSHIRAKCFNTLDAFVRLVALLVKHSGDSNNTTTKIHLLNKVLGIVAGCLLQDHEQRGTEFQQFPYHRIFIMLFLELNSQEPVLEAINFHVLTAYCHTLHILRPSKAAGFCYAWLELVSHRVFMGRMLAATPQQKGWAMYAQLLIDLFKYLSPFLRNAELAKPVTMLYKGTLRVLLVLLHDFPEFLCDYHYGFCDVIPPNCIQMRNLILSAFPRNMRLPDPFTPNLKVDILQEIAFGPRVLTNFASMITPATFKKDLDSYLKLRSPVTFLSELRSNLQVSNEPGMRYNIPLMNALVLYVGTQAISYIRGKSLTPNMTTIAHSAHMDIFQNLAVDLDTEGRFLFLNAIANQLRYPNSHTHYFSCTLLHLFEQANTEAIQEQITRVLLERLIVNRPHPWGLLITFIELIKNPTYKFWSHEFVHCANEIDKLFESVARSCFVQKASVQADGDLPE